MNNSQFFDPQRFLMVLKRQLIVDNRSWVVELGGLAGILLLLTVLQWVSNFDYHYGFFRNAALISFFAGGLGLTGKAFNELRSPGKALLYMNIPSSVFEKLATHWLLRALGFSVVMYVIIFLMSIVCGLLSDAVLGATWKIFNPLAPENLELVGHFLIWQSAFLLGAVYFKSNNLTKTLFSLIGIGLFLSFWAGLVGYGMVELYGIESMQMHISASTESGVNVSQNDGQPVFFNFMDTLNQIVKWLYIALAPFFLVVAYFHLKEREF